MLFVLHTHARGSIMGTLATCLPPDLLRHIVRLSLDETMSLRATCELFQTMSNEFVDVYASHPSTAVFFSQLPLDKIVSRPAPRDAYALIHTRMHYRIKDARFAQDRELLNKSAHRFVESIDDPVRRQLVTHVLWPCLKGSCEMREFLRKQRRRSLP